MSKANLGINGMGRIGRNLLRLMLEKGDLRRVVAVNDVMPKETLIYLLRFDSIRGHLNHQITSTDRGFSIDGHEIIYSQHNHPSVIDWQSASVELVVEATGLFTSVKDASIHFLNGAKRVLLTTYSSDAPTFIWGVNQEDEKGERVISPGDCTLNCVAPIINKIDNTFGVRSLYVNVIQGYTTRQLLLDGPYKGLRRGRAAASSIIPFDVNIKPVLEKLFPALSGKLDSMSTRVPIPCGALAELTFQTSRMTDVQTVNSLFEDSSQRNITKITFDPIVSTDILGSTHSGTVDGLLTKVIGDHVRLQAWFDNEWGYVNRLLDWVHRIS